MKGDTVQGDNEVGYVSVFNFIEIYFFGGVCFIIDKDEFGFAPVGVYFLLVIDLTKDI